MDLKNKTETMKTDFNPWRVNQDFLEVEEESKLECMEVYQCDLCPTFFNSKAGLQVHKSKGHLCEYCAESYHSVKEKSKHMSKSHFVDVEQESGLAIKEKEKKKKAALKITIDCSQPVEGGVMNCGDFENYLNERIRNEGKDVTLGRDKNKIILTSAEPFKKHYLKYLTTKYLKKNNLKSSLRCSLFLVPAQKDSYELRYFQINNNEERQTRFTCTICDKSFRTKEGRDHHIKTSPCETFGWSSSVVSAISTYKSVMNSLRKK